MSPMPPSAPAWSARACTGCSSATGSARTTSSARTDVGRGRGPSWKEYSFHFAPCPGSTRPSRPSERRHHRATVGGLDELAHLLGVERPHQRLDLGPCLVTLPHGEHIGVRVL